jgi:GNAT superfamily N-acetyltransferase
MASTDPRGASRIDALTLEDLPQAQALSAAACWNQNESDWRTMLEIGHGWGVRAVDAAGVLRLAASTVVVPYPGGFAWLSMVLVLPEFRRRGFASALLRQAIGHLDARGTMPVLDATPAGHAVYVLAGFTDTWGFRRYRREPVAQPRPVAQPQADAGAGGRARPLRDDDWPRIAALDRPAFGADRLALLRTLAVRAPGSAWVLERSGRIEAFVLGRDGREASQVGPLLAADADDARLLLDCALADVEGAVYVDLTDRHRAVAPWLEQRGFRFQRPFTRMVRSPRHPGSAPGDPATIVLVAGPELG